MDGSVIVDNPSKASRTPVFAGTRAPIRNLFDYLEGGGSLADFLEGISAGHGVPRTRLSLVGLPQPAIYSK
ncbi:MAG: DUF433 domain-containing protein [Acidobacteria bacterium]|nr:DUF433 domain-containing protein [Acidobacteriota bacterium]